MSNNIIEAKQKFEEIGYCTFSLKDFDLEFYELIKDYMFCTSEDNFNDFFTTFRFDSDKIETVFREMESFEVANSKKEEMLQNSDNEKVSQCWFYENKFIDFEKYLVEKRNLKEKNIKKYLQNKITDICKYFYNDTSLESKFNFNELQLTLYNKGCRFQQHIDGVGINFCSIIIYLNENYNKEYGGLLLLNDEQIVPELGKVALMDLETHAARHGVSEVTDGPGRFAILCFPTKIES